MYDKIASILLGFGIAMVFLEIPIFLQKRELTWKILLGLVLVTIGSIGAFFINN